MTDRLIASEPTPGQIIRELHTWIATYDDGSEGIVAGGFEGIGMMPLVTSRLEVARLMEGPAWRAQALAPGVVSVRLVTYRRVEAPQ